MHVLVIGRSYPEEKTGMMGIFELEQATALTNFGYKTTYLFCDTRSIKGLRRYGYVELIKNDISVYGYHLPIGGMPQIPFNNIKKQHYEKILRNTIQNEGIPDIIHVHFPLLTLNDNIWALLKGLNRPIVVTEHWSKVQTKELLPRYTKFLKKIIDKVDAFICVGERLKESILDLTGTKRDINIIPNVVSPLFYYNEKNRAIKNDFEFITIGRLVEVKRFDFAIRAFSKAFKDNQSVRLNVVGGGPLYRKLKQEINELEMSDKITMHGFLTREETSDLMRKSDAFVSASVMETFGVPFIEAMASGKPVIGVKNGPIDKYIDTTNGILFKSDDCGDLVDAFIKLYGNREKYNEKRISEIAINRFSEEAIAKQLSDVFIDCIEKFVQ